MHTSSITSLKKIHAGKVRDIYGIDDHTMLIVTTDRLSAFDVILPQPILGKGQVLTTLTAFWMHRFADLLPNQMLDNSEAIKAKLLNADELQQCQGRGVVVKKLKALPVECVARGYLIGSGWKDYQRTGKVCGLDLPAGLQLAEKLNTPLFTPADKAPVGQHDENISFEDVVQKLGLPLAEKLRDTTLRLYQEAAGYALQRGIIIADTKFEFGLDEAGTLHLIDEVLTPDSSRFWPASTYEVGFSPPSFDKQFVRDYLETLDWDKAPPAPMLPETVLAKTAAKYQEAKVRLMG
jgi:phosphoribosylaminoimidazole-succinocarboxamide synthase